MSNNELLKKALPYLEGIKTGTSDLIILISQIKDELNPAIKESKKGTYNGVYNDAGICIRCSGSGNIATTYGHDCWGKSERDYERCPDCNGYGRSPKHRG